MGPSVHERSAVGYNAPVESTSFLFICVGNTCRSPMAEAIARGLGGELVTAYSAGLAPTGSIADGTLKAITTLGYDPLGLSSKGLESVPLEKVDVVVSLIGRQGLLFVPRHVGSQRVAWAIPDPYGEELGTYVAVAREIERRVRGLVEQLR